MAMHEVTERMNRMYAKKEGLKGQKYAATSRSKENIRAAKHFQNEGDYYVKDLKGLDSGSGDAFYDLNSALGAYNNSIKHTLEKDEKNYNARITRRDSVQKALDNFSKERTSVPHSSKRVVPLEDSVNVSLAIPMLSMLSFFFALMFSSFSVTGLVTADKITSPVNYVALVCFMLGILFAGIYLKRRANAKKKSKKKIVAKKSVKKKPIAKKKIVAKKKTLVKKK